MISSAVVNKVRSFYNKNVNVTDFLKRQNYMMTNQPINKIICFYSFSLWLIFDRTITKSDWSENKTKQFLKWLKSLFTNNLRHQFEKNIPFHSCCAKAKVWDQLTKNVMSSKIIEKIFSLIKKLPPKIIFQRLVQVQKYKLKDIWKHDAIMSNRSLQQKNRLK